MHSQYNRTLADLPCTGHQVVLLVHLHRWRCRVPSCPRRIFAERIDPLAQAWARVTTRLRHALEAIGIALNGRGGVRLAQQLGISTTLLNYLRRLPDPPRADPEIIGIDEWSYRRGKRFGTIIVDLQRRQVIDLLPDRDVALVARWLAAHPTIRVISRDRSREFARAIEMGAPQAIQVVDRFHVLRNLVDKLPSILARCFVDLQATLPARSPSTSHLLLPPSSREVEVQERSHTPPNQNPRHPERLARYQQIHHWYQHGLSCREIGHRLDLAPATVWYWLHHSEPTQGYRQRASTLDRYVEYIHQRWQVGCHNGQTLWQEIQSMGYSGSARMLYKLLARLRDTPAPEAIPSASEELPEWLSRDPVRDHHYTLTQAQWLFVKWPAELLEEERHCLTAWCQAHITLAAVYSLVQRFRHLINHPSSVEDIEIWLKDCATSHVRELVRFAKSLRDEGQAVINGLTHPASNGQTEGQVNRLKLIKRQHFGRATFPLLRQHVLHLTAPERKELQCFLVSHPR